MFGRIMNTFEDYTAPENDIDAINSRAEELKNLREEKHKQVIQEIKDNQTKQKESQNKQNNITEKP